MRRSVAVCRYKVLCRLYAACVAIFTPAKSQHVQRAELCGPRTRVLSPLSSYLWVLEGEPTGALS